MTQSQPEIPEEIDGDPVVEVEEATNPLTPEEIEEAQEQDSPNE
jgi:hypothetical protein